MPLNYFKIKDVIYSLICKSKLDGVLECFEEFLLKDAISGVESMIFYLGSGDLYRKQNKVKHWLLILLFKVLVIRLCVNSSSGT